MDEAVCCDAAGACGEADCVGCCVAGVDDCVVDGLATVESNPAGLAESPARGAGPALFEESPAFAELVEGFEGWVACDELAAPWVEFAVLCTAAAELASNGEAGVCDVDAGLADDCDAGAGSEAAWALDCGAVSADWSA